MDKRNENPLSALNEVAFSPQEKSYFDRLRQDYEGGVMSGIRMICTQQELPGQWAIKQDFTGLTRVDQAQPMIQDVPPMPEASGDIEHLKQQGQAAKKLNGAASR